MFYGLNSLDPFVFTVVTTPRALDVLSRKTDDGCLEAQGTHINCVILIPFLKHHDNCGNNPDLPITQCPVRNSVRVPIELK